MLEPDVILRANINQISQCLWFKQGAANFLSGSSIDEDYPTNSMLSDNQEDEVCICGEFHILGECISSTSSDESE